MKKIDYTNKAAFDSLLGIYVYSVTWIIHEIINIIYNIINGNRNCVSRVAMPKLKCCCVEPVQ